MLKRVELAIHFQYWLCDLLIGMITEIPACYATENGKDGCNQSITIGPFRACERHR
ncbi:hypothetical protein FQZ97_1136360 [compost metagenome]